MTTKCPKCSQPVDQHDNNYCHTSPVSEVIAEMAARMLAAVGSTVALQDATWRTSAKQLLTAGFEKVASVAREDGFNLGIDEKFQSDRAQKSYDKGYIAGQNDKENNEKFEYRGAQLMKEKILAAIPQKYDEAGIFEEAYNAALKDIRRIITDLK